MAEAYRRQGYRVTEGGFGADGGIDLELRKGDERVIVQCKQWKAQKVGVSVVREMFGVLTASNAAKVVVICSGKFTQQAIDFASDKPIVLIDGGELLSLIHDVQAEPKVEEIKKTWDEEEKGPEIIETPSEVKGLNDMEIGKFN